MNKIIRLRLTALTSSVALPLALASCGSSASHGSGSGSGGEHSTRAAAEATCMPPGLEHATHVLMWPIPQRCQRRGSGGGALVFVRSENEFGTELGCTGDSTSGIDFGARTLVLLDRVLSPAQVGGAILDDGHVITFVSRMRPPAEGAPHPMPTPLTYAFFLPAGAERTLQERVCTLPAE